MDLRKIETVSFNNVIKHSLDSKHWLEQGFQAQVVAKKVLAGCCSYFNV